MANPFTRAALAEFDHGPGKSTDNVTSLGDGEAKHFGEVDFSSAEEHDAIIAPIKIKTGASGWAAGDTCSIYLIASEDGGAGVWTDGWVEATNTDQASKITTAVLVETIETEANATTFYFNEFSLREVLGFIPKFWSVVLKNDAATAGADLSSTSSDHYAKYSKVSYV